MSLSKNIITLLPDRWQDRLLTKKVINGPVDLVILPGGDHMGTETLLDVQIPQVISWLSNNLKGAAKHEI